MKSKLVLVYSLMIMGVSISPVSNAANAVVTDTIKKVTNWAGSGNETLWIHMNSNNSVNPASCSKTGWYILAADKSDFSRSAILAAKMSNAKISLVIWGGGCTPDDRPSVVAITLEP